MEDFKEKYWELWAAAPPSPRRPPTDDEMRILRAHKDKVRIFWSELSQEERFELQREVKLEKLQREKQRREIKKARRDTQREKAQRNDHTSIRPKDRNLPLWNANEAFRFHTAIPFCSHRNRSATEIEHDAAMGINRCVFSNLFVDEDRLELPPPANDAIEEMLGHAASFTRGLCAESFYMAAKCEHECDALFIMNHLDKSIDVASFGHHALKLTSCRRHRLVELGASPSDFLPVHSGMWLRGADGKLPVRPGWNSIRHYVFLYILREKFGNPAEGSEVGRTTSSLFRSITEKDHIPLPIEHRKADPFWGDGGDGNGFNVLGKTIAQVLLEIVGRAERVPISSASLAQGDRWFGDDSLLSAHPDPGCIFLPNNEYVDYGVVEEREDD